jgi:hypothetical protein
MTDKTCTDPMCTYTGSFNHSDAEAGHCTGTSGYIPNAELAEIKENSRLNIEGFDAKWWYDKSTDSDIMTFGTQGNGMTDWVAHMSNETKE